MAETAGLVLIDREMLIEEHQLPQGMNLSLTIKRSLVHLAQCVGLNTIDVSDDFGHVLVEAWGHLTAKVASPRDGCIMSLILATRRE